MNIFYYLAIFAALITGSLGNENQSRKRNILILQMDDLGWGGVSWHNHDVLTPNLEKFKEKAITLENFHTHVVCVPSKGATLTGRYPHRVGAAAGLYFDGWSGDSIPAEITLASSYMKDLGYTTHYVGKWFAGFCASEHLPNNRGFDTFYGTYSGFHHYSEHTYCSKSM